MRIVDPIGLSMAWVSTRLGGAVAALHVRESVEEPWEPALAASGSHAAVQFEQEDATGWTMTRRDPTSATFADRAGQYEHDLACESGALLIRVPASTAIRIDRPEGLDIETTREVPGKLVRLSRPARR